MRSSVGRLLTRFCKAAGGSILPSFAVLLVPVVGLAGVALDYSRATNQRASLQAAMDAAVLAGANDGTTNWVSVAENTFRSVYSNASGADASPQFSASGNRHAGSVTTTAHASVLTPAGYRSMTIGAASEAFVSAPEAETSCLLSLGQSLPLATNSMTFSGSPNVALSGCNLRSNTSMKCSGHDTGALSSVSAGTTTSCSNPVSGARIVSDIYKRLATNITTKCSSSASNIRWSPGSPPPSSKMVTVYLADRTEYHVCGDLTLFGTGSLTGATPANDTIIVIENGGLTLANDAAISATRTAIVFTGNNTVSSAIDFPNGNGHSASLTLSPPTTSTNPWAGITIYQDPALTYRVDSSWGPGATLAADGVVYMPNAALSLGGNATSASGGCTKIVANTVSMGGAVDVRQSSTACASLKVKQWSIPRSVLLTR